VTDLPARQAPEIEISKKAKALTDGRKLWGTDATMFATADGRLYWLFAVIDHYSDEVLGAHVVEQGRGDRWAALEPIKQALRTVCGAVGKNVADGIAIRHGHRTPREVREACEAQQRATAVA